MPGRHPTTMSKQLIAKILTYLQRVVPHGPAESAELLALIRYLESRLD